MKLHYFDASGHFPDLLGMPFVDTLLRELEFSNSIRFIDGRAHLPNPEWFPFATRH
jgi:hypothetical protein